LLRREVIIDEIEGPEELHRRGFVVNECAAAWINEPADYTPHRLWWGGNAIVASLSRDPAEAVSAAFRTHVHLPGDSQPRY
jgi:hypothetical protein